MEDGKKVLYVVIIILFISALGNAIASSSNSSKNDGGILDWQNKPRSEWSSQDRKNHESFQNWKDKQK